MKIEQHSRALRQTFTFGAARLHVATRSLAGFTVLELPYAELSHPPIQRTVHNRWLRDAGLTLCAVGAAMTALALLDIQRLSLMASLCLPTGLACVAWSWLEHQHFTVFESRQGEVRVVQDGALHDSIVAELRQRRRQQLLAQYGEINLANTPEREIAKFRWLAEQDALSRADAELHIARVKAAHGHPRGASGLLN